MAWRITDSLVRAELDNRTPGVVTGILHLLGREEPVGLKLSGNFMRDIAGCKLILTHPMPHAGDNTNLDMVQTGSVGEITASRKIRVPDVSLDEAFRLRQDNQPVPSHWGNGVSLEWYSDQNGRVLIENSELRIEISVPEWHLSAEEEKRQRAENQHSKDAWTAQLKENIRRSSNEIPPAATESDEIVLDFDNWDEFIWERELKRSDERTERLGDLLEEFKDHPDRDRIIARAMGWQEPPETNCDDTINLDELPEAEPAAHEEGVTWIRNDHGHIVHPLAHAGHTIAMDLWEVCNGAGFLGQRGDEDARELVDGAFALSTKLAGALNSLAFDRALDTGFVIALLKRTMPVFNRVVQAMDKVENKMLIPTELIEPFRRRLHAVREGMIDIMEEFRKR